MFAASGKKLRSVSRETYNHTDYEVHLNKGTLSNSSVFITNIVSRIKKNKYDNNNTGPPFIFIGKWMDIHCAKTSVCKNRSLENEWFFRSNNPFCSVLVMVMVELSISTQT